MNSFEKLTVWEASIDLIASIYLLTKQFPIDERFVLVSQMKRSALSISSNLAEGSARISNKEQGRFYEIAYGSLMELLCQILIAKKLNYIDDEVTRDYRQMIDRIARQIVNLKKSRFPTKP